MHMLYPPNALQIFAKGLDHPEGVAVGRDGTIYAGGERGQVYRISADGTNVEELANTGGYCLGLALDSSENIYVCDMKRHAVMIIGPDRKCEVFADRVENENFRTPNFGVFDRAGNLFVSESGDWKKANGKIYRIGPDGRANIFHAGPFHFTNGLALDAAEDYLYAVESNLNRVFRIPIQQDGTAGFVEIFADGIYNVPDGLAFDSDGVLYVTCYANSRVYMVNRQGEKAIFCWDEDCVILNQPTNCAFAGPDRNLLLISNLGASHLAAITLPTPGQPLFNQRDRDRR
jgi:gluconolactonase